MAERFHGKYDEVEGISRFRIMVGNRMSPWVLVRHPFWAWNVAGGAPEQSPLRAAYVRTIAEGGGVLSWDTFNLSRRQVFVREAIRRQMA